MTSQAEWFISLGGDTSSNDGSIFEFVVIDLGQAGSKGSRRGYRSTTEGCERALVAMETLAQRVDCGVPQVFYGLDDCRWGRDSKNRYTDLDTRLCSARPPAKETKLVPFRTLRDEISIVERTVFWFLFFRIENPQNWDSYRYLSVVEDCYGGSLWRGIVFEVVELGKNSIDLYTCDERRNLLIISKFAKLIFIISYYICHNVDNFESRKRERKREKSRLRNRIYRTKYLIFKS